MELPFKNSKHLKNNKMSDAASAKNINQRLAGRVCM